MQHRKTNSLESLDQLLTRGAKLLDKEARQIRDLPLEPISKNIKLIGESLANISEIRNLIYKIKPELMPGFLKGVRPYPREQGMALTRAMSHSFEEKEKGNIKRAVKVLEEFLATEPDTFPKSVAVRQIEELRKKYNI